MASSRTCRCQSSGFVMVMVSVIKHPNCPVIRLTLTTRQKLKAFDTPIFRASSSLQLSAQIPMITNHYTCALRQPRQTS